MYFENGLIILYMNVFFFFQKKKYNSFDKKLIDKFFETDIGEEES